MTTWPAILKELDPDSQEAAPVLPGTSYFVNAASGDAAADRAGHAT